MPHPNPPGGRARGRSRGAPLAPWKGRYYYYKFIDFQLFCKICVTSGQLEVNCLDYRQVKRWMLRTVIDSSRASRQEIV